MPQMIVPGCTECIETNDAILDAEAVGDVDFAYDMEFELATHNETHSEDDNNRRVSWNKILKR